MKKHPVIITVPHSYGQIPEFFRERIVLSDFDIWQLHDPYTDETCLYPEAFAIHKAKSHRIFGDLNRDRDAEDIFRENDFYGRKIWKDEKGLTSKEKEEALKQFWDPFRSAIKKSFEEVRKKGFKKILFIDHHNTATDHPAKNGQYLPSVNLGNFGDDMGNHIEKPLSSSPEVINAFQTFLEKELPELAIEMNKVYVGSALVRFVRDEIKPAFPDCEIHAIHLEYNLNLIFNPLSKNIDDVAKNKLLEGLNRGIYSLVENYFL